MKQVYKTDTVTLVDGTEIYITPLKIKYLREFLTEFEKMDSAEETLDVLISCTAIAMKQYYPLIKTEEDVEDNFDMKTIYTILDVAAGISFKEPTEEIVEKEAPTSDSMNDIDIVALESEAFLLGIWKDYEELESSLCMEELTAIINAKRENDYNEKKFLAAIQGVDLDEQTGNKEVDPWEAMKARVFSRGRTSDPNDVLSLQGPKARQAGFGINNGLTYEKW